MASFCKCRSPVSNGLDHFAISTEDHDLGPSKRIDLLIMIVGAARKIQDYGQLGVLMRGCDYERRWRAKHLKVMVFQVLENQHDQR
jgi:hypothetical protein